MVKLIYWNSGVVVASRSSGKFSDSHSAVSGSSMTMGLVRSTQPSILKEGNEYLPPGAESEIPCYDHFEDSCNGHAWWHSGALLGSSFPASAWLPDKGNISYQLANAVRFQININY